MRPAFWRSVSTCALFVGSIILTGCGTLTGIPSHGGGKRFATEQKLVAASIRASLKAIDVSILEKRKVFILYGVMADAGGGTLSGGRANLAAVLQAAAAIHPATAAASKFQIFDVAGSNTNYSTVWPPTSP